MTIREALMYDNKIETDLLLGHVLNKSKEFLIMNPSQKLQANQQKKFITACKLRQQGMPAAYILGYKDFYGLRLLVNKNVLIPRPETEWLVERAIALRKRNILDMGTGSGAIAIAVAKNLPYSSVTAVDISDAALKVAKLNNRSSGTKVKFILSDLFKAVSGKFDLIIANLPYVPVSEYRKMLPNLKHEPMLALTDGTDTSNKIVDFLKQAPAHLSTGGVMLLEIDPSSEPYISKTLSSNYNLKYSKDIRNLTRYAEISTK